MAVRWFPTTPSTTVVSVDVGQSSNTCCSAVTSLRRAPGDCSVAMTTTAHDETTSASRDRPGIAIDDVTKPAFVHYWSRGHMPEVGLRRRLSTATRRAVSVSYDTHRIIIIIKIILNSNKPKMKCAEP